MLFDKNINNLIVTENKNWFEIYFYNKNTKYINKIWL